MQIQINVNHPTCAECGTLLARLIRSERANNEAAVTRRYWCNKCHRFTSFTVPDNLDPNDPYVVVEFSTTVEDKDAS